MREQPSPSPKGRARKLKSKVTTAPSVEPVTLAEVKAHLRLGTSTAEDSLLTQFITDARDIAERYTGRKFITQTLTGYTMPGYGADEPWWNGTKVGSIDYLNTWTREFSLGWGNAQSITSIDTIARDNTEAVYASSNYYLDNFDDDAIPAVKLNNDADGFGSLRYENGIKIIWVAGYGSTASDVPAGLRRGILQLVGHIYSNRGDCVEPSQCVQSAGASAMLSSFRIERI